MLHSCLLTLLIALLSGSLVDKLLSATDRYCTFQLISAEHLLLKFSCVVGLLSLVLHQKYSMAFWPQFFHEYYVRTLFQTVGAQCSPQVSASSEMMALQHILGFQRGASKIYLSSAAPSFLGRPPGLQHFRNICLGETLLE